jgi:hypothetical protein
VILPLLVSGSFSTLRSFFLISYLNTFASTLSLRSSLYLPCDASTHARSGVARIAGPTLHVSSFQYAFSRTQGSRNALFRGKYDGVARWQGEKRRDRRGNVCVFALRFERAESAGVSEVKVFIEHPLFQTFRIIYFLNPKCTRKQHTRRNDSELVLVVPASFSLGPSRSSLANFGSVPDDSILPTGP